MRLYDGKTIEGVFPHVIKSQLKSTRDGAFFSLGVHQSLAEIADDPEPQVIAVDVPIGLEDAGSRAADAAARQLIGSRSSSVFNSPPAFALDPLWEDYGATNAESKRRYGCGISAQGFALLKNIREADAVARKDQRVHEVHPEVSFRAMNGESPLKFTKKSWNGQAERIALLGKWGIAIPHWLSGGEVGNIPADDLLDAAAAAWTADRIARTEADAVPDSQQRTGRIWF